jgi:hypothetical protein
MSIEKHISIPLDTVFLTPEAKTMRTTLALDDDVYKAAVKISKKSGERLGRVISKLARTAPPRRLPVFDVSPNSPKMSVERIDKFIEKEGLF